MKDRKERNTLKRRKKRKDGIVFKPKGKCVKGAFL